MEKRKVILITDGDNMARSSVETVAQKVGGRCISLSGGNPTPLSGPEIVDLVKKAASDPVLVMVDDRGKSSQGRGEQALKYIVQHPDIEVLGVVAVASNTHSARGTLVDFSITKNGEVVDAPVNKHGEPEDFKEYLQGDTVDVLNKLNIPIIVGVGDIGKQDGADSNQAPITTAAVKEILRRSGFLNGSD
jgi:stage V sporulation protein AE